MKKLTVGMCVYDDFDGVYFSVQSARMFHLDALDSVELLIVDNNPSSKHGLATRKFCGKANVPYLPFTDFQGTSCRNLIFEKATTPYVLVMDCHVMLWPQSLRKLIDFYDAGRDDGNLLQGPLVRDDLSPPFATHWKLEWREKMWGKWDCDPRGLELDAPPFEIPAHGLGVFSCRKDSWLGFNPNFRGFGGEEGYIHEKFRQKGKKTLCLPFLRWVHRFSRPSGPPYQNYMSDHFRNYMIGFQELGLDATEVLEAFRDVQILERRWRRTSQGNLSSSS